MNRAAVTGWWEALAPRERTLIGGGAGLLLAVIVYLVLWEPPAQGIRKLQADLPTLRAQDAEMRAMSAEAATLRSVGGNVAVIVPSERVAAVRRSLQRAGLWREGAPVAAGGRPVDAVGAPVSTLSVGGTVTTVSTTTATRSEPPQVTADGGDRVKVRFDDIDYGVWIAWLAAAEGELSARASKVAIVALAPKAPVGHVRAEALLDWTQPSATPKP